MNDEEVIVAILEADTDAALHWTVVWDRALRSGAIDPLADPDARDRFLRALATLARAGRIEKTSTGTYRAARA